MKAALNNLNDVVTCAINKLEAGETKKEAVQEITSFVENNYINKETIQNLGTLSIIEVEKLHEMGFEFEVNSGKVAGLRFVQGGLN